MEDVLATSSTRQESGCTAEIVGLKPGLDGCRIWRAEEERCETRSEILLRGEKATM